MKENEALKKRVRQLEAEKDLLAQALALTVIRRDPSSRYGRFAVTEYELDAIKSVLMNVEHNEANEPILVLRFEHDELF